MASVVVPRSAERLVFGAALALLLLVVVLIAIIGSLIHQQRCGDGSLLDRPPTAAAAAAIPPQLMPIFRAAEQRYGVPWNVLAAINKVETGLRAQHWRLLGRRDRLDAVHARHLATLRRRRRRRRPQRPLQPQGRDPRGGELPARLRSPK
jgi:hypothetical protein